MDTRAIPVRFVVTAAISASLFALIAIVTSGPPANEIAGAWVSFYFCSGFAFGSCQREASVIGHVRALHEDRTSGCLFTCAKSDRGSATGHPEAISRYNSS
jgi:hypothetical protein